MGGRDLRLRVSRHCRYLVACGDEAVHLGGHQMGALTGVVSDQASHADLEHCPLLYLYCR